MSNQHQLAARAKTNIATWKLQGLQNQAKLADTDPSVTDFIIDLFADTSIEELSDVTLEYLIGVCTADNLRTLGYEGARSNAGIDITPYFTALLHKVKQEFGSDAVRLGVVDSFRGIRNTAEIRDFYREEARRLTRRLMTKVEGEGGGWHVTPANYGKGLKVICRRPWRGHFWEVDHDVLFNAINESLASKGKTLIGEPGSSENVYTASHGLRCPELWTRID